ncbi:hypothetical protein PAXINDRAFT_97541 [Paxillus involutus ATCC 200175]|nr:hypothetical protein PAXINDRAFT_97541 [Paxillus involutus ATCC 200175]
MGVGFSDLIKSAYLLYLHRVTASLSLFHVLHHAPSYVEHSRLTTYTKATRSRTPQSSLLRRD